jgi:hypothetical protein
MQSKLFSQTFTLLETMPQMVGFSTLDVDRSLEFATPPGQGLILSGNFDPQAVGNAYQENLGMVSTDMEKFTIWCTGGDCTSGAKVDVKARMMENPFGGELGQRQPMSISADKLMASPDIDLVLAHLAAAAGKQPSLADDPAYQAAVSAVYQDALLIQALIANPLMVEGITNRQPVDNRIPPDLRSMAQQRVQENFQELPAFDLFILADVVTAEEQIARIGFVYQDAKIAETAAPILLERLANHPSLQFKPKLVGELLAERSVTEPRFYVVKESGRAVLVLEFPTRKATSDEIVQMQNIGSQATATPPGIVYRLFSQMIFSDDLCWMSTLTRAELTITKVGTLIGLEVTMNFSDIADGVIEQVNFGGVVIIELEDGSQVDAILNKTLWSQVKGGMKL